MAIQTLNTIKQWFRTSLKPSQAQFWDTWDSFRHKFEKVPVKDIEGIDELLLTKADKATLDNHLADKIAHAPQVNTDWNSESGVSQLINKPEFKTINGEEIVGDGDIAISSAIPTLDQVLNSDNKSLTQPIVFLDEEYSATIDSRNLSIDGPLGEGIQYNGDNINWSKGDKNLKLLFDGESAGQNIFSFPEMPHSSTSYKLATDQVVSATQSGLVDNMSLQELGGEDKLINGIRIGAGNLQVTSNTVLGNNSLMSTTTGGTNNTAIGRSVMPLATSAPANTGVGSLALNALTTGSSNLGIGAASLKLLTSGSFNMGVGNSTLGKLTTQSFNTAVGANAGGSVTGNKNTSIGYLANGSTSVTATGEFNISLGYQANSEITSGSNNVTIQSVNNGAELTTGNYNLIVKQGNSRPGIITGNNNTIIGNATGLNGDDSNLAIISDGSGNIAIRKEADNRLLAPTLTNALIDSGGAKSLVTKEYLDGHSGGSQNLQEILNRGNEAINTELVINETNNNLNSKTRVTGSFVDVFNISKKTNTTVNAGSIQGNGKNEDGSLQSSNMLNFTGRIEDGIANFKFNPLKPAGTYTLATLDDITGGSQNLQQTLNNGAGATLTSPNGLNQVGIDFLAYDSLVFTGISGNYGENGSSFVGVYNDSPLLRRVSASGSQLLLKIEEPSDEGDSSKHTIIQIPAKPSRFEPYTLATLDDINRSSTSQNLQQTLDKGGFAKSNSAAPAELTLIGDATEKILRFYVQKSDGNSSSETSTVADGILLTNSNISENKTAIIAINQGKLFLQQYKTSTGLSTKLTLEEPTVNTNIVVPAPSTAGTYTVALAENLPITIENDVIEEAQTSTQMDILYPNLRTNDKVIFKKFINGSKYAYEKISTGWIAYAIVIVP